MGDLNNNSPEVVQPVIRNNEYSEYNGNPITQNRDDQNHKVQNILCFWTIGFCKSFGMAVMSGAAYDIFRGFNGVSDIDFTKPEYSNNSRKCMQTSPAVLLLANTIPELLVKIALPTLPFYVNVNIILSCLLAVTSFTIVAVAKQKWQAIIGIICMSLCTEVGEITALAYLTKFINRKNLLLALSSGGGASRVAACLIYAALIDVVGLKPKTTLFMMLIFPLVEVVAFLFIKESNAIDLSTTDSLSTTSLIDDSTDSSRPATEAPSLTFAEKRQYLPKLIKYFIPLLICHICKHFIVQLFDLLYVPGIWLGHADQYRYLQVVRHIGSFVGQSSLSFISVNDVWPLNLLIVTFTMYFAFEATFMPVNCIWIIFLFVFLMGFISDCTNLNVYYRLTNETPSHRQVFAISSVSSGVTLGVIVSSILSIPAHAWICDI